MSATKVEETRGPEDKWNGLSCILSSPQEKKRGVASIHSASWEQLLVHTIPGQCVELVGTAVEDTGVTNWGQSAHPGTPFYPVLSSTGKAPHGLANILRWDTGKSKPSPVCPLPALVPPSQPTAASSLPRKATRQLQAFSPLEIFGHVACELTVLSKL